MQYFYHVHLVTRNTTKFGAKMSIQPFSKVFLFLNNKRKNRKQFSYYYWAGPWERLAHDRFRPAQPSEGEGRRPGSGLRPKADLAQLGRGETATPRRRSRRHGGAAAASGPVAVADHDRANRRERWVRKKMANPSGLPKGMEKGRRKPFHGEAKRGGAMTDDGENAQGRYTLLKWCPYSEHQVLGSEAERRVLDCGQW